jgi:hypothetical protein
MCPGVGGVDWCWCWCFDVPVSLLQLLADMKMVVGQEQKRHLRRRRRFVCEYHPNRRANRRVRRRQRERSCCKNILRVCFTPHPDELHVLIVVILIPAAPCRFARGLIRLAQPTGVEPGAEAGA